MLTTVYKNNNVLIRREPGFDGEAPSSLAGLLGAMCNGLDAPEIERTAVFVPAGTPFEYA